MTLFEEFKRRGLVAQTTNEDKIKDMIDGSGLSFYTGFDATADSLHVGHFLQLTIMRRMQQHGHRPIALLGTGTTLIGDPTGKTDMRPMLTNEEIAHNVQCFYNQMSKFINFGDDGAVMVKNGDWLCKMNYLDFLRDVGRHFSVNKMLTAECFKTRLEKGLSFLEFNYMLLQSYDYLHLFNTMDCRLELGGDDQWSNILGGVDLIRRVEREEVQGMTFTLLSTKNGKKMGKTEKGALWLDPKKCTPYEFFQYWRNVSDEDVINSMKLLTFIPIEEIENMERTMKGSELNAVKERLALELTTMIHGEDEAQRALEAARSIFVSGDASDNMPGTVLSVDEFSDGDIMVLDIMAKVKMASSKSELRRILPSGALMVDDVVVSDPNMTISINYFEKGYVILRKGKKTFHKLSINK